VSHTHRCSARRGACAVAFAVIAACGGTTEARSNDELEPGSGDLGPGDAPSEVPEAAGPDDDELLEEPDDGAPSSVPSAPGAACGTTEAEREIDALPAHLLDRRLAIAERATALQLGPDPAVGKLLGATGIYDAARVTTIACVDDGAATIAVALDDGGRTTRVAGSVMIVDGSWRVTLHSFCKWGVAPPCGADLEHRAADALSPALRAAG